VTTGANCHRLTTSARLKGGSSMPPRLLAHGQAQPPGIRHPEAEGVGFETHGRVNAPSPTAVEPVT
jgi:hypothetical protein